MDKPKWEQLLLNAVREPGTILPAYTAFHRYSILNQMLAHMECRIRKIQPGPLASFTAWREEHGRHVKAGQKAIQLCMPVTVKSVDERTGEEEPKTVFIFRPRWFVLSQTDGPEPNTQTADWDKSKALPALNVEEAPFESTDGNCMGYAEGRKVHVSPLSPLPLKTLFHELGHVLLGHTDSASVTDSERVPKSLREVEAESVSLLCLETFGLEGQAFCRGYIQDWLGSGETIPEANCKRIMSVADRIITAGIVQVA